MEKYICGLCRWYDSDNSYCMLHNTFEIYEEDTCDDWAEGDEPTNEELEAARTDAAERENHRKEVEGDIE